ncbi:glycosyltransferase [soil metagenome]
MISSSFDVVIPTAGRTSLRRLLEALASGNGPPPGAVIVVSDGGAPVSAMLGGLPASFVSRVRLLGSEGRGPAAARNAGWRAAEAEWVAFLDDDVVPPPHWYRLLSDDLEGLPEDVAGSQGRIHVPLPGHRRPTDWERNVAGLSSAVWATADMAYRRSALAEVGGFDERFPRAYREDADIGLRIVGGSGRSIVRGGRWVEHPVRPADEWVSVRLQAGNADDVLMRALHGRGWRESAGVPNGRRARHLVTTAAGGAALAASLARARGVALGGLCAWVAGTAELAWHRIAPGPRDRSEVTKMLVTSVVVPPAATLSWVGGWLRLPGLVRRAAPHGGGHESADVLELKVAAR